MKRFLIFIFLFVFLFACINEDIDMRKKDVCGTWETTNITTFNDSTYFTMDLSKNDSLYRWMYANLCNMWVYRPNGTYSIYDYDLIQRKLFLYLLEDSTRKNPSIWQIEMLCDSSLILESKIDGYNIIYDLERIP